MSFKFVKFPFLFLFCAFLRSAEAQNFTMTLEPNTVTLVPGQSSSLLISLTPIGGFSNNVTLSTVALPNGITATFSPNPVTPPGTSVLMLTAATNAAVGSFTLNVMGVGGGITNTTSSSVSVDFGLLPLCTSGFTGQVTDFQTGLPIPYATLLATYSYSYSASANNNGVYTFTNVALGANNAPLNYSLQANASNYWYATTNSYAVCDTTNTVNIRLIHQLYGTVSGNVTLHSGGVAAGVSVTVYSYNGSYTNVTTDSNGNYATGPLILGYTNAPNYYMISSQPSGDWLASSNTYVQANSNSVVNLTLYTICYDTVTGNVVYSNTLAPATNASVYIYGGNGAVYANTDANGNYTLTNAALAFDDASLSTSVSASATGYYQGSAAVTLSTCGTTVIAPQIKLIPIPVVTNNYGMATGHVYDSQTSLPITNASVTVYGYTVGYTDSHGAYFITNILVGTGAQTNTIYTFAGGATGYFTSVSNVVVDAGLTSTQDFYLLRVAYGEIQGTARDSATTLPLTNIYVDISGIGYVLTDTNGHYYSGPIALNSGNVPTAETIYSQPTGYYQYVTNTTITNGMTNVVDLNIIKVCTGATIIGNVVNAVNQQPITNATVYVSGYASDLTDSNGNFILTNITVGNLNSPLQVTVNATAPGYNPQSHSVTIFCDATINTEFGAPQTAFGIIEGLVTNVITGQPLVGAFIGSSFGEATTTDSNGFYQLTQAPLGANNSSRSWNVTAIPTNFTAQTLSIVVYSNAVSTLNFGFGGAPTHLLLNESSVSSPVPVGSNLVYTITLVNSGGNAANVVLTDQLASNLTFVSASITNPPGGPFTLPVYSNGVVTTTATNFGSNQVFVLVVDVVPTITGIFTNITTVNSSTPDSDPTGTNRTAMVINNSTSPATPYADLGLALTASPNPVLVSNQLTYTFIVTNNGPTNAPSVVLSDALPTNLVFASASESQGSYLLAGSNVQWNFGAVSNHGTVTATLVVMPAISGLVTNSGTVSIGSGSTVMDTNQANNIATIVTTVNAQPLTNVSVQALGTPVLNYQTGLFGQSVLFQNLSSNTAAAIRLYVLGLPSTITLYNASGLSNGVPYVEYDQAVPPGGTVTFALEYFNSSRHSFVSTNFLATAVIASAPTTPHGTIFQVDNNSKLLPNGTFLVEFVSTPGMTYVIQYGSNTLNWNTAVPPIVAAGTKVQWIDAGPPKTSSVPPTNAGGSRYYRVIQTSGATN